MSEEIKIGIIGGSGLYAITEQAEPQRRAIPTPFGHPSDDISIGTIADVPVAFIARHGRGHRLTPSEVPYAANIYALKSLGVRYIIAVSACGSLREDYQPGHICLPDQLVDMTRAPRIRSFFGEGLVGHVGVAQPFSPELSALMAEAAEEAGATVHRGGTFITIEGPRFSTRAESHLYRQWGHSLIGMTTSPEAFLALEAEIAYAVYAHITDYDVWHESEAPVSAQAVVETVNANIHHVLDSLRLLIPRLARVTEDWPAHHALSHALMTNPASIPPATLDKLRPIVGKYYR